MKVRFNWEDNMVAIYTGIFSQAHLPAAAIGSIINGKLLSKGRRLCLYVLTVTAMLGIGF